MSHTSERRPLLPGQSRELSIPTMTRPPTNRGPGGTPTSRSMPSPKRSFIQGHLSTRRGRPMSDQEGHAPPLDRAAPAHPLITLPSSVDPCGRCYSWRQPSSASVVAQPTRPGPSLIRRPHWRRWLQSLRHQSTIVAGIQRRNVFLWLVRVLHGSRFEGLDQKGLVRLFWRFSEPYCPPG